MQFDPTRLLVSWAGFVYDWIITREWSRAMLCLLPAFLLGGLGFAVAAGSWMDRGLIAQRYIELGNEEIANWEQAWAPVAGEGGTTELTQATEGVTEGDTEGTQAKEKDSEGITVSPFAESLFRRVQMLSPSDRSQFVIAATLAQRGAVSQAKALLAKIAPEKGRGYVPAHALMAQLLIYELQGKPGPNSRELAEKLVHHADQAKQWDRVPRSVLLAASDLNVMLGKASEAEKLLAISAERFPEDNFSLAQVAKRSGNKQLFDEAMPRAEEKLIAELAEDDNNTMARMQLSHLYAMNNDLDKAEKLLLELPEEQRLPEIQRVLSNLYLTRYDRSFAMDKGKVSVEFQYLDNALRADPSNPLIAQAVAKLVRMQGPRPSEELISHLLDRLAAGSATGVTHAYIAELYLVRQEFAKAIPHLEQVLKRMPSATEYLNNLAYCLAEIEPARYSEALELAQRAVELSKSSPVADYYDTLSYVLSRLDRHLEAVTAIETAIEINPKSPEFHARAASEYRLLQNEELASAHERIAKQLRETPVPETAGEKQAE